MGENPEDHWRDRSYGDRLEFSKRTTINYFSCAKFPKKIPARTLAGIFFGLDDSTLGAAMSSKFDH
jgi:hypothetical protein